MQGVHKDLYKLRGQIRKEFKGHLTTGAIDGNIAPNDDRQRDLRKILQFGINGPFGAQQRDNPCDYDEVCRRLNDPRPPCEIDGREKYSRVHGYHGSR